MTLHASKGLEFPAVLLAGLKAGLPAAGDQGQASRFGGGAPAVLCGHDPRQGGADPYHRRRALPLPGKPSDNGPAGKADRPSRSPRGAALPVFSGQQSTFAFSISTQEKGGAGQEALGGRCVWFLCSRLSELTILPSPSRDNQENFFVLFSAYIFFGSATSSNHFRLDG